MRKLLAIGAIFTSMLYPAQAADLSEGRTLRFCTTIQASGRSVTGTNNCGYCVALWITAYYSDATTEVLYPWGGYIQAGRTQTFVGGKFIPRAQITREERVEGGC